MSVFKTAAAACLLTLSLTAPLAAQEAGHAGHGAPAAESAAAPTSPASTAYMEAMTRMDDAMRAMPMSGQAAHDFAAMMIPHHRAAIEMAEAYLASGDADPALTRMANEIVAAQKAEIATLEGWLAEHPNP